MTLEHIRLAIDSLSDDKGRFDDEVAHMGEDNIHQSVLAAIASGSLVDCTPAEAAKLALTTVELDFARWCA